MRILSGIYKNKRLKSPKGKIRPTSNKIRESVFNSLQHCIKNARFLDIFAGSGSMGIEALSRGAKNVVFVESDKACVACIYENLAALQCIAEVYKKEAETAINYFIKHKTHFDIIYIDPPYNLNISSLLEKIPQILAPDGIIVLEQSKRIHIKVFSLEKVKERRLGDTALYFFKGPT